MRRFDWREFGMTSSFAHAPNQESVKAIRDLHRRVGVLEAENQRFRAMFLQIASTTDIPDLRDFINQLNGTPGSPSLQARVDEFVKWAQDKTKISGYNQDIVLAKLRELGLVEK